MTFFSEIAHGLKAAAKGAAKVGEAALLPAEIAAPVILPGPSGEVVEKIFTLIPQHSAKIVAITAGQINDGGSMNQLEAFAVSIILGVLQTVIKNPAHAAQMKGILLGVAGDIYTAYGMVPPVVEPSSTK